VPTDRDSYRKQNGDVSAQILIQRKWDVLSFLINNNYIAMPMLLAKPKAKIGSGKSNTYSAFIQQFKSKLILEVQILKSAANNLTTPPDSSPK
jgi:hypothetical protein